MYRSYINLKTLPKNNLHKLSLLKFDFIEYKVNINVIIYEIVKLIISLPFI